MTVAVSNGFDTGGGTGVVSAVSIAGLANSPSPALSSGSPALALGSPGFAIELCRLASIPSYDGRDGEVGGEACWNAVGTGGLVIGRRLTGLSGVSFADVGDVICVSIRAGIGGKGRDVAGTGGGDVGG